MEQVPAQDGRGGGDVPATTPPDRPSPDARPPDGAAGSAGPPGATPARLTVRVEGHVQGVGFRAFVRSRGTGLGLAGSATNLPDRSVEVVAEGPADACRALVGVLRDGWTPGWVTGVHLEWGPPHGDLYGFSRG